MRPNSFIRFQPGLQYLQAARLKNNVVDWTKNKAALDALISEHRGNCVYDCIVPFSGGKDSTWTLYYLVKEYKIKPLVVRFDHGFLRPNL